MFFIYSEIPLPDYNFLILFANTKSYNQATHWNDCTTTLYTVSSRRTKFLNLLNTCENAELRGSSSYLELLGSYSLLLQEPVDDVMGQLSTFLPYSQTVGLEEMIFNCSMYIIKVTRAAPKQQVTISRAATPEQMDTWMKGFSCTPG